MSALADYLIGNPSPNLTTGVEAMGGYGEVRHHRALYLFAGIRVFWRRSDARGRSNADVADALATVCNAFAFGGTQSRAMGRWVRLDVARLLDDLEAMDSCPDCDSASWAGVRCYGAGHAS